MITNFKIYEEWFDEKQGPAGNLKFKKGDYVIAIDLDLSIKEILLKNYLENNVGQIINIDDNTSSAKYWYEAYYEKVPKEVKSNFWMDDIYNYEEKEIRLATPEEVEIQKQRNKFNI